MKHRIPISDVHVGMYIAAIDGSWWNNPFWRTRFAVKSAADIERLRRSGVEIVTIDDTLGAGVPAPTAAAEDPAPADAAPIEPALVVERRARPRPRRAVTEIDRARTMVERSKVEVTRMFTEARLGRAIDTEAVVPLVDEIAASIKRDRSAILNVTRLKTKNEYTYMHSVAVCALMITLGRQIGLSEAEVQEVGIAGLLHDIGKMTIPDSVLDSPAALDAEERKLVEGHPQSGHALLCNSGSVSAIALDVCLHHHERVDGRGYPFGLTQDQLSLYARMGAICDVYDAVTSERPYKNAWSPAEALARMSTWEGHFDEQLLRAFIVAIGIFPIGSLVRLHSNRLAVVMSSNEASPTSPRVRAFFDVADGVFTDVADVETCNTAGGDPIIRGEHGDAWFGASWLAVRDEVLAGVAASDLAARFSAPGLIHAKGTREAA